MMKRLGRSQKEEKKYQKSIIITKFICAMRRLYFGNTTNYDKRDNKHQKIRKNDEIGNNYYQFFNIC